MNNQDEKLWYLISLKLSGEASELELKELDNLIKTNVQAAFQVELLERMWQAKTLLPKEVVNEAYNKHLQRLSNFFSEPSLKYDSVDALEPKKKRFSSSFKRVLLIGSIAASFIIGWLLLFPSIDSKSETRLAQNSISTKHGSKSKIQLPDGTQVWLNSGSKLTYNETFTTSNREVCLSGEAYFDVIKDKDHPFLIHAKAVDIKVLGTAFNVRSYPDEKMVETSLIRGVVELTLKNYGDKKFVLRPNQKFTVADGGEPVHKDSLLAKKHTKKLEIPPLAWDKLHFHATDTISVESSWIENKLAFDQEIFGESVVPKIERWYNVEFIIKNDRLTNLHFTGGFDNKSLQEVMEALRVSLHFRYKIKGNKVTVW